MEGKEELKGKIKFYEDEIVVLFPESFDVFKTKLCETLGLTEDFLLNVRISYKDEDDDKIEMKDKEDYNFFLQNIRKKNDILVLLIEVKEESDLMAFRLTESFISFDNNYSNKNSLKISQENINNKNNNIDKNKNNNNPNISKNNNINIINNSNNNPNNSQYNNINNNINNNLNNNNQHNNNQYNNQYNNINNNQYNNNQNNNINNNYYNNNKYNNNQSNNINSNNNSNTHNNKYYINQSNNSSYSNNSNNLNNQHNNNNNISHNNNLNNQHNNNQLNNIKHSSNLNNQHNNNQCNNIKHCINLNNQHNNNQNNNINYNNNNQKDNQLKTNNINQINNNQINNNRNNQPQINNQIPQNQNNNNQVGKFTCPYPCHFCRRSPIMDRLYYCKTCNYVFCSNCELVEGPKHIHSFYKIRNLSQYNYLNLEEKYKIKNIIKGVESKLGETYNNVKDYLKNDTNNNNMNQRQQQSYILNLIKIARNKYDLRNITDKQIEDALVRTNYNIDSAVILLTTQ